MASYFSGPNNTKYLAPSKTLTDPSAWFWTSQSFVMNQNIFIRFFIHEKYYQNQNLGV